MTTADLTPPSSTTPPSSPPQLATDRKEPAAMEGGPVEESKTQPTTPPEDSSLHPPRPTTPTHHPRPRTRSPYSQSYRSSSGSSPLCAPPMTRAHSLPTVMNHTSHGALSPPRRTRSPFRIAEESYAHSGAPSVCDISEDAELELTPRPVIPLGSLHSSSSASLSRPGRRRPASPLHQVSAPFGAPTSAPSVGTPRSMSPASSSPLLSSAKFNEPFPGANSHYPSSLASSSVPSTPTSMRSRSPSISSLETIPDTPDAEAEALEADRIARLKAAADRESSGEDASRRSSLDVPGERRNLGFGKRDSRKRWSVCGAERRGDLDLETIWED